MTDILSSKELDDEQKARLFNQVMQRFLTYFNQRKGQPLHVKISTPRAAETPKPEENEQPTEERVPEKLKRIQMSCIGMIKESCCLKPNPF